MLYHTLMSIGSSMFDIAGLMTLMSIFPSSRGAVIAVMKTFVGLGSSILACILLGFFADSISGFFYFMSLQIAFVGFAAIVFIELPPYHLTKWAMENISEEEKKLRLATKTSYYEQVPPTRRFGVGFVVVFFLIVFLPAQSAVTSLYDISHGTKQCFALCAIGAVFLSFAMCLRIPWLDAGHSEARERLTPLTDPQLDAHDSEQVSREALQRMSARIVSHMESTRGSMVEEAVFHVPLIEDSTNIPPQYTHSFRQSLCSKELWALTFSVFCISGTQMVIIVNARFIYAALVGRTATPEETVLLTVINGTGSALGRIAISCVEMFTQRGAVEKRMPLTKMLFIPTFTILAASVLLLCVPSRLAVLPFVVTALGNGITAATGVLVIRGLYAMDVANHYNFTSIGVIVASFLLNKCLYGYWYTYTAEAQGGTVCYGRQCIRVPFVVMTTLTALSLFTNYWLNQRYVAFCASVFADRARSQPREASAVDDEDAPLLESV
ncbi:hypothetical protein STCU_07114 [Strigomonas culicis]|nr:hypothetical protein STCU_07114 [Strigomonas culicis]|eukprot:EPY24570.1 hypothetical protein STCU_07114 [Strigomonas culicis]